MRDSAAPQLPAPQRAMLSVSAAGARVEEVAADLRLPAHEVRRGLAAAVGALGARSKLEAILIAHRLGLIVAPSPLQRAILGALAGGATLVGTPRPLARALGVGVGDLRAGLRGLLEARLIAVYRGPRGQQLVIRLERRVPRALPPLPPAGERRRPGPAIVPL